MIYNVSKLAEYTIKMRINNWEITRDGQWLREEPNNTWLKQDWVLTVKPDPNAQPVKK